MCKKIVIIGAGGHAKVAIDIIKKNNYDICGLTDIHYEKGEMCMGIPVLGTDSALTELSNKVENAAMGIGHVGHPQIRNELYSYAKKMGFYFPVLVHPSAVIADTCEIGEGTLCAAQSVVNPEAHIGKMCIVNSSAVIEHEVRIGEGVHVAPRAVVLGNAHVGDNAFIGAGSVVLQGIHIGRNCIIGAGSVVLHDVSDDCVVVGNPGRIIKRR